MLYGKFVDSNSGLSDGAICLHVEYKNGMTRMEKPKEKCLTCIRKGWSLPIGDAFKINIDTVI